MKNNLVNILTDFFRRFVPLLKKYLRLLTCYRQELYCELTFRSGPLGVHPGLAQDHRGCHSAVEVGAEIGHILDSTQHATDVWTLPTVL